MFLKQKNIKFKQCKIDNEQPRKEANTHAHSYLHILGENTELYFAIISGICWVLGVFFSLTSGASENIATPFFVIGAFFGGIFELQQRIATAKRAFNNNSLTRSAAAAYSTVTDLARLRG